MELKMKYIFLLLLGFIILSCSYNKPISEINPGTDTIKFVDAIMQKVNDESINNVPVNFDEMINNMESYCENGIHLPLYTDMSIVQQDIEKALGLDSSLIFIPQSLGEYEDAIIASEFLFRFICAGQKRLEEAFSNEHQKSVDLQNVGESYPSKNGEYIFHFEQNVSELLPYTQKNLLYSDEKTKILIKMLDYYSHLTKVEEKEKYWIALERMLNGISLNKSETEYEMFQRRFDGITTKPSAILEKMKSYNNREMNPEIQEIADNVINLMQKRLDKRLEQKDKSDIALVEENRRYFQTIKNASKSEQEKLQNKSEWFELAYNSDDNYEKIKYYSHVINIDSTYAAAYNNRGNAYLAIDLKDKALADYETALSLDPDFQLAFKNRGSLYFLQENYQNALSDLNRAIELDPLCSFCFLDRGKTFLNLSDFDNALNDFHHVILLDSNIASAYNYIGDYHKMNQDYEIALENYAKAIEINPLYSLAYNNRGIIYRYLGRYDEAIADYSRTIEIDPNNAFAYNNRGVCFKILKKYELAISDHQKALELSQENATAYYNLGCVYWEQKKWSDVIKNWEKCLEIKPEHQKVKEWLLLAKKQARQR